MGFLSVLFILGLSNVAVVPSESACGCVSIVDAVVMDVSIEDDEA